jgi:hypothetical protein
MKGDLIQESLYHGIWIFKDFKYQFLYFGALHLIAIG